MSFSIYRVAILKDTSKPMLGLHALHVAFRGLPNVEVVAHVDSNSAGIREKMAYTQARRHSMKQARNLSGLARVGSKQGNRPVDLREIG